MWWFTLALTGCGEAECKDGFAKANDGLCYPIGTGDDDDTTGDDDDTTGDDDDDDTISTSAHTAAGDDDDDTVAFPDLIDDSSLAVDCSGTTVTFEVFFLGEASQGVIDIFETTVYPRWNEHHTLDVVDLAPNGTALGGPTLPTGVALAEWGDGIGTLFTCPDHFTQPVLTYVVRVYDTGGILADCVAWGDDPEGVIRGDYSAKLFNDPIAPLELETCRPL